MKVPRSLKLSLVFLFPVSLFSGCVTGGDPASNVRIYLDLASGAGEFEGGDLIEYRRYLHQRKGKAETFRNSLSPVERAELAYGLGLHYQHIGLDRASLEEYARFCKPKQRRRP